MFFGCWLDDTAASAEVRAGAPRALRNQHKNSTYGAVFQVLLNSVDLPRSVHIFSFRGLRIATNYDSTCVVDQDRGLIVSVIRGFWKPLEPLGVTKS